MAEVRKFKPGAGSQIAEAVAKAMGESVRPITPGAPPEPTQKPQSAPTTLSVTAASSFVTGDAFFLPAAAADEPEVDES